MKLLPVNARQYQCCYHGNKGYNIFELEEEKALGVGLVNSVCKMAFVLPLVPSRDGTMRQQRTSV